jgi:CubicO group peptidase (beta-lactamase class C family)
MRSFLLCIVLTISASACVLRVDAAAPADNSLSVRVKRLAQPWIDANKVVGISIGFLKDGRSHTVHLGQTNDQGNTPDDDTVYEIGSASKVFTGILLADAVVRGSVRLNQPVQDLLPEGVTMPVWKGRVITPADLSVHRSALPRIAGNMPMSKRDDPYADYSSSLALAFLNTHKLRHSPGTKHEYSNLGTALLGYLIAEQAKVDYDDLLQQRISQPLGMSATRVRPDAAMKAHLTTPHVAVGQPTKVWDFSDMPGAGGILSSTHDMLLFAEANISPPDNMTGKAIELAWKKHRNRDSTGPAMGLGWHFAGDDTTRWHNGQTGGSHSMVMINRERGLAVVVLANTGVMELDKLAHNVMKTMAGLDVKAQSFEKTMRISDEVMQRYEGQYQLTPAFVFTVSVKRKQLIVGITNQPDQQVFPRSETEWFYKGVDATLKFQLDASGKCEALQLIQNGSVQTARRIN